MRTMHIDLQILIGIISGTRIGFERWAAASGGRPGPTARRAAAPAGEHAVITDPDVVRGDDGGGGWVNGDDGACERADGGRAGRRRAAGGQADGFYKEKKIQTMRRPTEHDVRVCTILTHLCGSDVRPLARPPA